MTIHGAKGLESNIVILPDTCGVPDRGLHPKIFFPVLERAGRRIEVPVWRVKLDRDPRGIERLRAEFQSRQMEEHERLLYVAMTRAADRLYVCGAATRDVPDQCWYRRIETALRERNLGGPCEDGEEASLWRYEHLQQVPPPEAKAMPGRAELSFQPLPPWASAKVLPETASMPWLAPSRAAAFDGRAPDDVVRSPLARRDKIGFRRGALIHRLLQSLPALAPGLRAERAAKYLALKGHGLSSDEQREIAATVMRLLEHDTYGAVFAKGGLAEVPIVARVKISGDRTVAIDGRIDRLVIEPHQLLILDFKSNRPPPDSLADIDASYIRQLALYRRAMLDVFPDRAVRAALLWTEGPNLMELPRIGDGGSARLRPGSQAPCRQCRPTLTIGRLAPTFQPQPEGAIGPHKKEQRHGHPEGFRPEFRERCFKGGGPCRGRFLGRMVWSLPHDCPSARRDRQ